MIQKAIPCSLFCLLMSMVLGCGSGVPSGPRLAAAGGIVKFKGSPLAGATVTLVSSEKGTIATGVSDAEGKFNLTTAGSNGAPVGTCKVSVTAAGEGQAVPADARAALDPSKRPSTPDEAKAMMQKQNDAMKTSMMDAGKKKAKSAIPDKYMKADTSGLTVTVTDDPSKNQFTLDLSE